MKDPSGQGQGGRGPKAIGPGERWSVSRKRMVVLRLLRGEDPALLSKKLGLKAAELERWRDKALVGIDSALRKRQGDPLQAELEAALKRVQELTMENELLRKERQHEPPFLQGRS